MNVRGQVVGLHACQSRLTHHLRQSSLTGGDWCRVGWAGGPVASPDGVEASRRSSCPARRACNPRPPVPEGNAPGGRVDGMIEQLSVAVLGANGRMGEEAVKAIDAAADLNLVAALGRNDSL